MNFHDAELLSAYLDDELTLVERQDLERRLAADAGLRQLLDDLRVPRGLLRRAPRRRAPRNFTLRISDARVRAPRPLAVPLLRYAGALASILFLFSIATNTLVPALARVAPAAPVYGVGGGMGGGGGGADSEVESPQALAASPAGTPAPAAPSAPQDAAVPTAEALAKSGPPPTTASERAMLARNVVPSPWLWLLGLIAVLGIGISWYLDRVTRRRFRTRRVEK